MSVEELLNCHYEEFSENEKYVSSYLIAHFEECAADSIEEFAEKVSVSKTLLVRFAKKLGMSGYSELKARLKLELQERKTETKGLMETVTGSYHKMMDNLVSRDMRSLFRKLEAARRVFVYGSGSSQARAASEMKRIFLPAKTMVHLHGHDMCRALQQIAGPKDLVILISLSGESQPVTELAGILRTKGVETVSITRMKSNSLAALCGENLYIHSIQMPAGNEVQYEIATPYFILIEFLYLSYQNYLAER